MTTFIRLRPKLLFGFAFAVGCVLPSSTHTSGFRDIALRELREHPNAQVSDLFKLAYHAAMGPEHMHMDVAMAAQWLRSELRSLGANPTVAGEPLFSVIAPDGSVVRVNVRPYLNRGGNPDSLARAFVETAALVARDTALLVAYWNDIQELARDKRIGFSADSLSLFLANARAKGFTAPSHSRVYADSYRPAYRVVHRSLLKRLGINP